MSFQNQFLKKRSSIYGMPRTPSAGDPERAHLCYLLLDVVQSSAARIRGEHQNISQIIENISDMKRKEEK